MSNRAQSRTRATWTSYRETIGDRSELFAALVREWGPRRALYVGSYVDLSPSTAIESVVYVDTDRRAARFFADDDLLAAELAGRTLGEAGREIDFEQDDYTTRLPLGDGSVDLLISLYAGPTLDQCLRYVRPGGLVLANASHGDASLAGLHPRLTLVAVAHEQGGRYLLSSDDLETYLVPRRPALAQPDLIRASGKGLVYTREAFAYVFSLQDDPSGRASVS